MICRVSSLLLLLFQSPASALLQWESLGLQTESISSISIDPSNPLVIYIGSTSDFSMGTVGKVFKSTDEGSHWDTLMSGLNVRGIVIHPDNPNIIYVASASPFSSVFKSIDGGNTWWSADSGIILDSETGAAALAINPLDPQTLYCGTGGFFGGTLYKSTSGGSSWFPLECGGDLSGGVVSIALDPLHPDTLFVGTADQTFVARSTDGGVAWNLTALVGLGLPYTIAVDPFEPQRVFAGLSGAGLHRTTDSGFTWVHLTGGIPDSNTVFSVTFNQQRQNEAYCAVAGIPPENDIWRSTDGGDTWNGTQFPVNLAFGAVSVSPLRNLLYAGGRFGLFRTPLVDEVDEDEETELPTGIKLVQNYPNPFNSMTVIPIAALQTLEVDITVLDVLGQVVTPIFSGTIPQGEHFLVFNAASIASGIYFCSLRTHHGIQLRKMVLEK